MSEEPTKTTATTETTTKTTGDVLPDSTVFGISVRAWIVIMFSLTICATHMAVVIAVLIDALWFAKDWGKVGTYTNISEPLYGISMIAIGFFFGQKTHKT